MTGAMRDWVDDQNLDGLGFFQAQHAHTLINCS